MNNPSNISQISRAGFWSRLYLWLNDMAEAMDGEGQYDHVREQVRQLECRIEELESVNQNNPRASQPMAAG